MDNRIVDTIKQIRNHYGDDVFHHYTRVKHLMSDLAPEMAQERIHVNNFLEMGGYFTLKYSGSSYSVIKKKLTTNYAKAYSTDLETAAWIVEVFAAALGYIKLPRGTGMAKALSRYKQQKKDRLQTVVTPEPPRPVREEPLDLPKPIAPKNILSADYHTVVVKRDGTVLATGPNNERQCDVWHWNDIVSVAAGSNFTIGLRGDGTLVASGANDYGQCDVLRYEDIVSVSAGVRHTVMLRKDGYVFATGENKYGECDVANWRNIVAVKAGYQCTYGIKKDGKVLLKGHNRNGELDVSSLTDVINIANSSVYGAIALKKDGTIVKVRRSMKGDFSQWRGVIDIAATPDCFVALLENGTVVMLSYYWESTGIECSTQDWRDIVAIAAGRYHIVGLKADGSLEAALMHIDSRLDKGQCSVKDWNIYS